MNFRKKVTGGDLCKLFPYFRVVVKVYDHKTHSFKCELKGCKSVSHFTQQVNDLSVVEFAQKYEKIEFWETPNRKAWQLVQYDYDLSTSKVILVLGSDREFKSVDVKQDVQDQPITKG
jgi:hypothetical protein